MKSVLACFAHPDDELGVAPIVARVVAEGGRATLICTTDGDVGTVDEQYMRGYSSIAELRLAELACAAKTIGFTDVITFGYRDSGMMGTAENDDPSSSWQAPLDELTARVVEVMRQVKPQVVITFNTYGAYGHPDHIKINQATVAAFQQLQGEPEHPERLYYVTLSQGQLRLALRVMRLLGKDPRHLGRNKDLDLVATVEAITPTTTRVPVGKYGAVRLAAMRCHASQMTMTGVNALLGRIFGPLFFRTTTLSRVYPAPRPGQRIERDIF